MAMAPKDDLSLHAADIQLLSSRDRVLEFFTRLGYNTGEPVEQRVEAMGLTSEDLKRNIRRIERIADQDEGVLEVYLAELKSVTQASIQALARGLRDLESNFLWVLTSDYDRLDFVLFERTMPQAGARGITFKGAYLRPRTLTVSRQNPGPVALRVLKRFTNTEPDAYYQWDKLRSAYNIADWTEQFFNNRALFSDYYLNVRLRDEPEWREKPEVSMRAFGALFANVRERLSGRPEDAIRRDLFEPAFRELGFSIRQGNKQATAGHLIEQLNPVIRGWANYHRHVVSAATFHRMDHAIFKALWSWAKRRHLHKARDWIKHKYFQQCDLRDWVFYGEVTGREGKPQTVRLLHAASVAIKRHTLIQATANPYDPAWEPYFEHRLGVQMAGNLAGRRKLLYLWKEQKGRCPVCRQKITKLTGWDKHHIVWRVYGGSDRAENQMLLHPNCHRQVHSQELEVAKPRPATSTGERKA